MSVFLANQIKYQLLNSFHPSTQFHLETSHLICDATQMVGFYMKCNTGRKQFSMCSDIFSFEILSKILLEPDSTRKFIQENLTVSVISKVVKNRKSQCSEGFNPASIVISRPLLLYLFSQPATFDNTFLSNIVPMKYEITMRYKINTNININL